VYYTIFKLYSRLDDNFIIYYIYAKELQPIRSSSLVCLQPCIPRLACYIICILVVRSSVCIIIYSWDSTTTKLRGLSTSTAADDVLYLRTHAHPSRCDPIGFIASDTQPSCLIARDRYPGITLRNSARNILRSQTRTYNFCVRAETEKWREREFETIYTRTHCIYIDLSSTAVQLLFRI